MLACRAAPTVGCKLRDLLNDESKAEFMVGLQQSLLSVQIEMWKFTIEFARHDLESPHLTRLIEYPIHSFDIIVYDIVPHLLPLADHIGNILNVETSPYVSNPMLAASLGHSGC
ncbi:hypothetical protein QE152_g40329 [Popillia japonica]|uniref:Uncharacterized protein n=1 Tax=Popillia japonica TaxID=7064 RepID=A0AAW1HRS8_POPJA